MVNNTAQQSTNRGANSVPNYLANPTNRREPHDAVQPPAWEINKGVWKQGIYFCSAALPDDLVPLCCTLFFTAVSTNDSVHTHDICEAHSYRLVYVCVCVCRCKVMDMRLGELAPRHLETKFLRIDAEKAPFFVQKLQVR